MCEQIVQIAQVIQVNYVVQVNQVVQVVQVNQVNLDTHMHFARNKKRGLNPRF